MSQEILIGNSLPFTISPSQGRVEKNIEASSCNITCTSESQSEKILYCCVLDAYNDAAVSHACVRVYADGYYRQAATNSCGSCQFYIPSGINQVYVKICKCGYSLHQETVSVKTSIRKKFYLI